MKQFNQNGCYKSNEMCLIVATINPISHSCPVHHGTFFNVLIDKFRVYKTEKSSSLHTIILKTKHKKATLCLELQSSIFFSKRRLGPSFNLQSVLTLIV